jgi:hypothetical protein
MNLCVYIYTIFEYFVVITFVNSCIIIVKYTNVLIDGFETIEL